MDNIRFYGIVILVITLATIATSIYVGDTTSTQVIQRFMFSYGIMIPFIMIIVGDITRSE